MKDGVILVNKPVGWTSRDVVNKISHMMNTKKVGHTGTLDPFASGLMLVTIGKATKISSYLEAMNKKYIAELALGKNTTTLDLEGEVTDEFDVNLPLDKNMINEVIHSFEGDIEQVPPMYSAIKINGVPLYKLARENIEVERKKRKVHIDYIKLLSITDNRILFEVSCSKGTYIRTLGNDIGTKLGTGGYLTLLTRVSVGKYHLKDAKEIEDIHDEDIISVEEALSYLPTLKVDGPLEKMISNGVSLILKAPSLVYIESKSGKALAIYELKDDGKHHCLRGLC